MLFFHLIFDRTRKIHGHCDRGKCFFETALFKGKKHQAATSVVRWTNDQKQSEPVKKQFPVGHEKLKLLKSTKSIS